MRTIDRVWLVSLFFLLVSSLIAATSLMATSQEKLDTETARHKLIAQRDSIARRVDEIHYLEENYQQYKQLIDTPVSSAQRRVTRAELIDKAASDLGLPSMSFVMHPFQPLFDIATDSPVAGYEETEIELRLIHDTQLIAFLEYLNKHTSENAFASKLEVKRLQENASATTGTAKQIHLQVNCTIRWFSYQMGNSDAAAG